MVTDVAKDFKFTQRFEHQGSFFFCSVQQDLQRSLNPLSDFGLQ